MSILEMSFSGRSVDRRGCPRNTHFIWTMIVMKVRGEEVKQSKRTLAGSGRPCPIYAVERARAKRSNLALGRKTNKLNTINELIK